MEVSKPIYTAGEFVEGCIYLNAKETRAYRNLVVRLVGNEHVYWREGSRKHRRTYRNHYNNYDSCFQVASFDGSIGQGQYIFPFGFLLPAAMSGSFNFDDRCYIRYSLQAIMNHPTDEKESQVYEFFLNIMEPPRAPIAPISKQATTEVKCCGCCKDYGSVSIDIQSDKNFAFSGDTINITGNIDNSQGSTEITEGLVTMEERRVVISQGGATRYRYDQQYYFGQIPKVNPGQNYNFHYQALIPEKITSYTAIGRVTARFFVLIASAQIGCCTTPPHALMHIVINSKTPNVMKQQKMPPPEGWYPHESPKITCTNMKPFVYSPLPSIPFHNLPPGGIDNLKMVDPNQGMQPQFEEYDNTYQGYNGDEGDYQEPGIREY